ncbi:hypothetical protein PHLGIDRAFT_447193 [Phlebiopsis gigantea 11061_1 CR5-6]|uniref:Uncharacterized protein n=1 Tax=Phlebiopsis gigantea (strain 11061_1 CR5-6) TaxID=745531 RepID=A0A0C3NNS3_PHLG1|nr:hypothetical protein PHLGIDRAFT_447193 [Phlebiopsis gigantea 11061_1 CR5-6]
MSVLSAPAIMSTYNLPHIAKSGFQSLFHAQSREEFDLTFDKLVADPVTIMMDGEFVSRSHYKEYLWRDQRGGLQPSSSIEFQEVIEGSLAPEDNHSIGSVGLFYEVKLKVADITGLEDRIIRVSANIAFGKTGNAVSAIPMVTSLSQVSKQLSSLDLQKQSQEKRDGDEIFGFAKPRDL